MSALMEIGTRLRAGLEQSPLWHRWQHLPPRDRLALALLGGFLALVLFYLAVWSPVAARVERARAYQQQQLALFTYIQSNADRARRQGPVHGWSWRLTNSRGWLPAAHRSKALRWSVSTMRAMVGCW